MAFQPTQGFEFLLEASAELSSSQDWISSIQKITRWVIPDLADGCIVLIRRDDGVIDLVESVHRDPRKAQLLKEMHAQRPLNPDSLKGYPWILRNDPSEFRPQVNLDARHMEMMRVLQFTSCMTVPMVARGVALGTISFFSSRPERQYSQADLKLAEDFARQAGMALENTRLHGLLDSQAREHQARLEAEELVRSRTRELETARDMLVQTEKLAVAGQLAAGVGHEINNPLAFVSANLNFVEENLVDLSKIHPNIDLAETLQCIREAVVGSNRIRDIVKDLKTFSRTNDGESDLVDVQSPLEFALTMATNEIRHRATLRKEFGTVPLIRGHASKLGQVFLNLLVNAVHAIPEGNASQNTITVRTSTDASGDAIIEIQDTGSGIDASVLPRIFEPFFTTKPLGQGTGLGLSICHGIIKALGGDIRVENRLPNGTIFRLILPAADLTLPQPPEPKTILVQPSGVCRILVIDDEPIILSVLRKMLGQEHRIITASNGREALELLAEDVSFDVILCDLMMPEISGMDFYSILQKQHPSLAERVTFMTGGGFTPKARDFLLNSSNRCLDKPLNLDEVRMIARTGAQPQPH